MKNTYINCLFLLFILLHPLSFQSKAQLIDSHYFGKLKYGMSLNDVVELDIQVYNITGEGQEEGTAKYQIITLDVFDEATLFFKHGGLKGVGITFRRCECRPYEPDTKLGFLSEDCRKSLSKVENDLTARYGKPKIKKDNMGISKTWFSSTSKIELTVDAVLVLLSFEKRK